MQYAYVVKIIRNYRVKFNTAAYESVTEVSLIPVDHRHYEK